MAFDKAKPSGSTKIRLSDEEIRANWTALETALGQDHDFTTGSTQTGKHQVVVLDDQGGAASNPTGNARKLYNNGGYVGIRDDSGNDLRVFIGESGTKTLFYQDSAPTGWTLDTTMNDKLVFVTKGSGAGGETGGSTHSSGTWTQPSHTLATSEIPAHDHGSAGNHRHDAARFSGTDGLGVASGNANYYTNTTYAGTHTHSSVGGGGAHNHGSSWRPACYCVIAASKD